LFRRRKVGPIDSVSGQRKLLRVIIFRFRSDCRAGLRIGPQRRRPEPRPDRGWAPAT